VRKLWCNAVVKPAKSSTPSSSNMCMFDAAATCTALLRCGAHLLARRPAAAARRAARASCPCPLVRCSLAHRRVHAPLQRCVAARATMACARACAACAERGDRCDGTGLVVFERRPRATRRQTGTQSAHENARMMTWRLAAAAALSPSRALRSGIFRRPPAPRCCVRRQGSNHAGASHPAARPVPGAQALNPALGRRR
jgi:hypothetical protein